MQYLSDTINKKQGEYTESVTILLHIAEITWQVITESYTMGYQPQWKWYI